MQIRLPHPVSKRVKLKAKREHRSPTQTVLIMVQGCLDADDLMDAAPPLAAKPKRHAVPVRRSLK